MNFWIALWKFSWKLAKFLKLRFDPLLTKVCALTFMIFMKAIMIFQVSQSQVFPRVRVPQEISDQLLHEMETSILEALVEEENKERHLPDIFLICSLMSNLLYGYFFTRFVTLRPFFIYLL